MIDSKFKPEGSLIDSPENARYLSSLDSLTQAMHDGMILEAPVVRCSSELSLTVELGALTGRIERDECVCPLGEPIKDIAVITRVGKSVAFKVVAVEPEIVLSRRAAQRECIDEYISALCPGDIIAAKVTHLEHFGAFVDIGCGVIALLPIDSISVSRISHPRDRLSVGCELTVAVKTIEYSDGRPSRVFVTQKELLGTWEENAARFSVGQTVTGIIRSIESYGVFIELAPNLAGLAEYRGDVSVGQAVAIYIKSIIPERMKLKLVIVDPYRAVKGRILPEPFVEDCETHISRWKYSPDSCEKLIETIFE